MGHAAIRPGPDARVAGEGGRLIGGRGVGEEGAPSQRRGLTHAVCYADFRGRFISEYGRVLTMIHKKTLGTLVFGIAVCAAVAWLDPKSIGIYSDHKQALENAHWCFQHDVAKLEKNDLERCDTSLRILGHGDEHQGIVNAVAELTGIDCDKEHDNPNLTDKALKSCAPIWWPGMLSPEETK